MTRQESTYRNQSAHYPTRDEAMRIIWENSDFNRRTEIVRIEKARGRVLAEDVHARYDVPTALTCRWDGVAVRYDDFSDFDPSLQDTHLQLKKGDFAYGNTGVAMPEGFDTLVRIEDIRKNGDGSVDVVRAPAFRGEYTTAQASTLHKGEIVGCAHETLSPRDLGVLATGGITRVRVMAKPRVAIIPSGNELTSRDLALGWGKNYETNSLVLANEFEEWGADPIVYDIIPDDAGLLLQALKEAAHEADIVVFNAGSSKGTDDHAREVLESAGNLLFHRTTYGPGNHTGYAVVDGAPVLALVGVPGGADLNAGWYGPLLVRKYFCQPMRAPHVVRARLLNGYTLHNFSPVQMYVGVVVKNGHYGVTARVIEPEDGYKLSFADANGLLLIEPEWGGVEEGQEVDIEMRLPWEQTVCEPLGFRSE